jgi:hypothetical protein
MLTTPQTLDTASLRGKVFGAIQALVEDVNVRIDSETALIGDSRVVDSMKLVELCLALEDLADGIGFSFDWTSEAAMSRSRGMFRSAGALADAFVEQATAQTA